MATFLDLKYRPSTYEEVIGQESAVNILKGERYKSYVLHGQSGGGKTTLARIFAKQNKAEVIEIDASEGGVDLVRSLKELAQHPSLLHNERVIIIDEAHDLNEKSWNALLKVIEDAPTDTIWMMCTTKLHKVPDTIQNRSRLVRLNRIEKKLITKQLQDISDKESIDISEDLIERIAVFSDGSMRQAVKSLNTYADTGEVDLPQSDRDIISTITAIFNKDTVSVVNALKQWNNNDIYMAVRVLSEFSIFFSVVRTKQQSEEWTEEVYEKYTTLSPQLNEPFREMTTAILGTVPLGYTGGHPQYVIKKVYELFDLLMKHYNHFGDNRYSIQTAITYFISTL